MMKHRMSHHHEQPQLASQQDVDVTTDLWQVTQVNSEEFRAILAETKNASISTWQIILCLSVIGCCAEERFFNRYDRIWS